MKKPTLATIIAASVSFTATAAEVTPVHQAADDASVTYVEQDNASYGGAMLVGSTVGYVLGALISGGDTKGDTEYVPVFPENPDRPINPEHPTAGTPSNPIEVTPDFPIFEEIDSGWDHVPTPEAPILPVNPDSKVDVLEAPNGDKTIFVDGEQVAYVKADGTILNNDGVTKGNVVVNNDQGVVVIGAEGNILALDKASGKWTINGDYPKSKLQNVDRSKLQAAKAKLQARFAK